jgi:hypothetical protein
MTRKDYVKFAAMLAEELSIARQRSDNAVQAIRNVIFASADIFAQDSVRFDRQRFYRAAGLEVQDGE